jgi:uncharacterized protein with PQ loop repeat
MNASEKDRGEASREEMRMVATGRFNRFTLTLGLAAVIIALSSCEGLVPQDTSSLLVPRFQRSEILGFVAGFGTTFAALPDLIGMFRRRSSAGMNPRMVAIMAIFQIVWVYYGLLILSRPVIAWNLIAVLTNSLSVGSYFYFVRREKAKGLGAD